MVLPEESGADEEEEWRMLFKLSQTGMHRLGGRIAENSPQQANCKSASPDGTTNKTWRHPGFSGLQVNFIVPSPTWLKEGIIRPGLGGGNR